MVPYEGRDALVECEVALAAAEEELGPLVGQCLRGEDAGIALAAAKRRTLAAAERLSAILKSRLAPVESRIVALRLDGTEPAQTK